MCCSCLVELKYFLFSWSDDPSIQRLRFSFLFYVRCVGPYILYIRLCIGWEWFQPRIKRVSLRRGVVPHRGCTIPLSLCIMVCSLDMYGMCIYIINWSSCPWDVHTSHFAKNTSSPGFTIKIAAITHALRIHPRCRKPGEISLGVIPPWGG